MSSVNQIQSNYSNRPEKSISFWRENIDGITFKGWGNIQFNVPMLRIKRIIDKKIEAEMCIVKALISDQQLAACQVNNFFGKEREVPYELRLSCSIFPFDENYPESCGEMKRLENLLTGICLKAMKNQRMIKNAMQIGDGRWLLTSDDVGDLEDPIFENLETTGRL